MEGSLIGNFKGLTFSLGVSMLTDEALTEDAVTSTFVEADVDFIRN
jgi:hypothetical protein